MNVRHERTHKQTTAKNYPRGVVFIAYEMLYKQSIHIFCNHNHAIVAVTVYIVFFW